MDNNKICEECYENCETCNEGGSPSEMHCLSCSNNKIKIGQQCYIIHDEKTKSFLHPTEPDTITGCFELYHSYIKENS